MNNDAIYREYYERVLIFVRIKINYHPDAEDLTQEILISFMEAANKGKTMKADTPLPYLYGICANKIRDWYKSRKKKNRFDDLENIQKADPDAEVLEKLINDEERKKISEALKRLKHSEQRILYLRYYQGLNYKEIASLLNMKNTAVRKIAQRARDKMRGHLKNDFVTFLIWWILIIWSSFKVFLNRNWFGFV